MLGAMSVSVAALLMAAVLIVYGTPYNSLWWWVMLGILIAAAILPGFLLGRPIEWIFEGYRKVT